MSDAPASPSVSPLHLSLLLPLLAFVPLQVSRAQDATTVWTGTISGIVQDQATGAPLPGAQVTVMGVRLRGEAGPDGRYTVSGVPPGTYRVQAQIIGYEHLQIASVIVTAGQTATADFRLKQLAVALQEIVVVGYGTQVRRDVTGSVASVSAEDVQTTPKANAVESMKGRVPGLDIVTTGNKPGDGVRVRLRGTRSLQASNDPLYVLDGIPMAGGIGDLNPNEIESLQVLKDASATAIYGSRGANGVVLITTRQGRAGATSISYDTHAGVQEVLRRAPMMNGPEFAEFKREANRTTGNYKCPGTTVCATGDSALFWPAELDALAAGISTDWQDLVLREGPQISNEVRISGGDDRTRFSLSGNQLEQQGIVKAQEYVRRSMRLNFDHRLSPRFHVGSSTSLVYSNQRLGRGDGVYTEALGNNPLGVPYDSTGRILFKPTPDGQRVNPLSDIRNQQDDRTRTRVFGTLFADVDLTEALNWRMNFGADLTFFRRGQFWGAETQARQGSPANAGLEQSRTFAYTLDNILTYRQTLGSDHRLDATFVYSIQEERTENQNSSVTGLPYEEQQYYDLGSAIIVEGISSDMSQWALQSVMARLNYALKDRYLLTVTSRLDGSSRLAPGQKYGLFPSVAVAWRLSEEDFIRRTGLFSDLKLRAGYGRTGNTAISPYQTQGSLARVVYAWGDQGVVGYRTNTLPNPNLKWESTGQLDVGLEFAALNNRLSGSVDYYRADTRDLIMARQIPPTSGYTSILENVGATRNTGVEVALSTLLVPDWHGLRWNVDVNAAANRNRIVRLSSGLQRDLGNTWFVGFPIDVVYDYQFGGIWQLADSVQAKTYGRKPGEIRIVDQNGDGKIDDKDRIILGTSFPEWTAGLASRLDWKGIDLSVMAVARVGSLVHNELRTGQNQLFGRYNNLRTNYWTPTNPSNVDPRPNADQESPTSPYGNARGYEDGSFIRVRNITVGYTVPGDHLGWMRARSLRIYATALDPFLFSKFQGLDPESRTSPGVPSYRTFLMGVTLGL